MRFHVKLLILTLLLFREYIPIMLVDQFSDDSAYND